MISDKAYPQQIQPQQRQPPIEEEGFLKALSREALKIEDLTRELELRGVAFPLTPTSEREISRLGHYLGKDGIKRLIDAVRSSYRPHQRLRVSLLRYAPCEQHYDEFAELLNSKLNALPSMLISKDGRLSYTAGLKLVKEEKSGNMSLLEANEYWEKTRSLQLLQGICTLRDNDLYVISQVFLGALHGGLANTVRIEFRVDPKEFGTTRDIHSLLILYSLAKDAQIRGLGKDVIIAYLSEALGIAAQIKQSDQPSLESIRSEVINLLRELGAANLAAGPVR